MLQYGLPVQLSAEQLLALIRLYENPQTALTQLFPLFLDQPFTQPKAILLRVLEKLRRGQAAQVRGMCEGAIGRVQALDDPVLNLAARHLRS